jgi:hypothetical protein
MIQVAVALGIADSLHDGPKPATKLVTDSGADANMVKPTARASSVTREPRCGVLPPAAARFALAKERVGFAA